MTSPALAGAKLGAAMLVLVVSFAFVLATAALWMLATGTFGVVLAPISEAARAHGGIAVALAAASALFLVIVLSWKGMVGAMVPPLTGRAWVAFAIGLVFTVVLLLVGAAVVLFATRLGAAAVDVKLVLAGKAPPPRLVVAVAPEAIGLMLGLKLALAAVAFRAAIVRRMIGPVGLATAALLWAIPAGCLLGLGALMFGPSSVAGWLTLAMTAALLPPLGRLPAATLALDWNRHR
jgi:hypothetical protein